MKISRRVWQNYIDDLRKINDAAAKEARSFLQTHDLERDAQAIIDYCFGLSTKYGEAATELAAQMYDALALAEGVVVPAAVPAETASYGEVAQAINGAKKFSTDIDVIASAVARLVKLAGVDTTMNNALRDGAEWAWIPHGDTCAYCIMLASRGWTRASKKDIKNGHAEHIHANCDCTYAIRFDSDTDVEGYNDGVEYREMYDNADGRGLQKVNSMRREFYARNRERINEQKRSAYEKRKERESSAAEEIDVG